MKGDIASKAFKKTRPQSVYMFGAIVLLSATLLIVFSGCSLLGDSEMKETSITIDGSAIEKAPPESVLNQEAVRAAGREYGYMLLQGRDGVLYAVSKGTSTTLKNSTSRKVSDTPIIGKNAVYRVSGHCRSVAYVMNATLKDKAALKPFKGISNVYFIAADSIELLSYTPFSREGVLSLTLMAAAGSSQIGYWDMTPYMFLRCKDETFELHFLPNTQFTLSESLKAQIGNGRIISRQSINLPTPAGSKLFLIGATYRAEGTVKIPTTDTQHTKKGEAQYLAVDVFELVKLNPESRIEQR